MTIGIPRAFLYYRYQILWETFFSILNCDVVVSGESNCDTFRSGNCDSVDENCLPFKLYLGHVKSLIGKCDYILIPRFERHSKNEEFCVRFLGLQDIVRTVFPDVKILCYDCCSKIPFFEQLGFIRMGATLGVDAFTALSAYKKAKLQQEVYCLEKHICQKSQVTEKKLKVLIASHPYILHDKYMGGIIVKILKNEGVVSLFSDAFDRQECLKASKEFSGSLYWIMNAESSGAILRYREAVDGVILLTAFPCGSDLLVNELIARRIKNVPLIQITIDGQGGEAGLQTRVESFVDILRERRCSK